MTRSNLSVCSRGSSHTFRRHRGIAVAEVMMSVILLVIGSALAFPSYRDMVHKRHLGQQTELLSSSSTETTQAISSTTRQPEGIFHSRSMGNDWCAGAMEYPDLPL